MRKFLREYPKWRYPLAPARWRWRHVPGASDFEHLYGPGMYLQRQREGNENMKTRSRLVSAWRGLSSDEAHDPAAAAKHAGTELAVRPASAPGHDGRKRRPAKESETPELYEFCDRVSINRAKRDWTEWRTSVEARQLSHKFMHAVNTNEKIQTFAREQRAAYLELKNREPGRVSKAALAIAEAAATDAEAEAVKANAEACVLMMQSAKANVHIEAEIERARHRLAAQHAGGGHTAKRLPMASRLVPTKAHDDEMLAVMRRAQTAEDGELGARTANALQTLGVPPEASNLAAYFAHTGGAGGKTTTMAQSEQTSSMPALRALDGLGI